jgi:hypothetical protein
MGFVNKLFRAFGSFGFAVVLLVFLLILTWLGTLEQVEVGLYEVQKKYFDSLVLVTGRGRSTCAGRGPTRRRSRRSRPCRCRCRASTCCSRCCC